VVFGRNALSVFIHLWPSVALFKGANKRDALPQEERKRRGIDFRRSVLNHICFMTTKRRWMVLATAITLLTTPLLQAQVASSDPETIFYTNLVGLSNSYWISRFNSGIAALKQDGLWAKIADMIVFETNYQNFSAGTNLYSTAGRTITNVGIVPAARGCYFSNNAYGIMTNIVLGSTNAIYTSGIIDTRYSPPQGSGYFWPVVWQTYSNADTSFWPTYAQMFTLDWLNLDAFNWLTASNGNALTTFSEILRCRYYRGVGFFDSFVDGEPWTVIFEQEGTNAFTYAFGMASTYSNAPTYSLNVSNQTDTLAIGALVKPKGAGGGPGNDPFVGWIQLMVICNTNLSLADVKHLENDLLWFYPGTAMTVAIGDSRTGNQLNWLPDVSWPIQLMNSPFCASSQFRRFSFPSQIDYYPNTNWPDMLPQLINYGACPNLTIIYEFGLNGLGTLPAESIWEGETNSFSYFSSLGAKTFVFSEALTQNALNGSSPYALTNIPVYDQILASNASEFYAIVPYATIAGSTNDLQDGLHPNRTTCSNIVAWFNSINATSTGTGAGQSLTLSWPQGTLLQSGDLVRWTTNPASSPYTVPPTNLQIFFKVRVN
jgi:hypothetical protein